MCTQENPMFEAVLQMQTRFLNNCLKNVAKESGESVKALFLDYDGTLREFEAGHPKNLVAFTSLHAFNIL